MKIKQILLVIFLIFAFVNSYRFPCQLFASEKPESPDSFFGFHPGTDGMLFDYEALVNYLQKLDEVSPRLRLVEIGRSPLGKSIYIAFISSEENIQNLENLKTINKMLALDPNIPESERETLIRNGKVFILATLSMHSGEVGPSQSAPILAYELVTTTDTELLTRLNNVVFMMVPCHNPDGMDLVVNHYHKYKGTKYDGSSMPGVYHKYVGHDNNRDFVILSQSDTRAIARIYNQDWFPQVMVEKHQMGSGSARYFVPPAHDPIAENVDENIWSWTWIFGSNMAKDLTAKGLAGVSQHYLFDDYWPGSTETCIWKNVIGLLTECASVKYATPIFIEPNELSASGKGLAEYKKSINMTLPWPGGWWRLSDIIEYEIASTMSLIKTGSLHREDILRFRNDLCRNEVKKGQTESPFFYLLPIDQHDKSELVGLVNLLKEHGVNCYRLSAPVTVNGQVFAKGDIVVPLAQPFRAFIKEVLEAQKFPVRRYTPGGEIIKPYDIASWSLPLHRGIKAIEIKTPVPMFATLIEKIQEPFKLSKEIPTSYQAVILTVHHNESFKAVFEAMELGLRVARTQISIILDGSEIPAGSFVVNNDVKTGPSLNKLLANLQVAPIYLTAPIELPTRPLPLPRIALVESWFHDMDAGWTRFIFDSYQIPFEVVRPGDFEKTDFSKKFDVLVFPDVDESILMSGKYKSEEGQYFMSSYPPEYARGIEKKGMEHLIKFLDNGGIIISWGQSTSLFLSSLEIVHSKDNKEEFQLPVRDIAKNLQKSGLYCPGSLLEITLTTNHPLTYGMPENVGVFFRGQPVFVTSIPNFDMDRRVIGKFPEKEILLSGYCEKEELLGNKTAMVWLKKGKGQLVLFAFNPQFRASTQGSFKLLFNSLLLPGIE